MCANYGEGSWEKWNIMRKKASFHSNPSAATKRLPACDVGEGVLFRCATELAC
jgi:hypothetical protein